MRVVRRTACLKKRRHKRGKRTSFFRTRGILSLMASDAVDYSPISLSLLLLPAAVRSNGSKYLPHDAAACSPSPSEESKPSGLTDLDVHHRLTHGFSTTDHRADCPHSRTALEQPPNPGIRDTPNHEILAQRAR